MDRGFFIFIFTIIVVFLTAAQHNTAFSSSMHAQWFPQKIRQGDAALLKLSSHEAIDSVQGMWKGVPLQFCPYKKSSAFFSIIGIDLAEKPGKKVLELTVIKGRKISPITLSFTVKKRDFKTQRLTLPSKMVTLSPENLDRVKRENQRIKKIWTAFKREKMWHNEFLLPVHGDIIAAFGSRRIINGKPRSPHTGVDLQACEGMPVLASGDGIVVCTGDFFFSGKSVFIDHGMGIVTMYFHLSSIAVKEGERVRRGQSIGRAGATGRTTAPHLHWGVRVQGNRVNPLSLLSVSQKAAH